jgi:CubicO group peptidase (beta-lactamase class C family)
MLMLLLLFACSEDEAPEPVVEPPVTEAPVDTVTAPVDTTSQTPPPATTPPTPAPTPTPLSSYFPSGSNWETLSSDSLNWDNKHLSALLEFLQSTNTYGFMVLYKGRIVTEKYWNGWNQGTRYPIASAGKSIASFLIGIAQQEGLLNITDKVSDHLGTGWTSLSAEKENKITIRHLLSMTSGLDESEDFCTSPACLKYKADAGTRWAYHNGPYNLLHKIIEASSGVSMNEFTKKRLSDKIGLHNSTWAEFNLELSTRDMARFGWLVANGGVWNGKQIMTDTEYFKAMTSPSSTLNKAYGFLWWLNGSDSYMVPGESDVKSGPLAPSAPGEMIAAMGKGDKKIYILADRNLVIVRHGDDAGTSTFGPSSFDSELWSRLKPLLAAMPADF